MCPCCKVEQQHTGLYKQRCSQQVKGNDGSLPFGTSEMTSCAVCAVLHSGQERHCQTGASQWIGHQGCQAGAHDVGKEGEGWVCSAWRQGLGGSYCCVQLTVGGAQKRQNHVLLRCAWGQNERQWAQVVIQKILTEYKWGEGWLNSGMGPENVHPCRYSKLDWKRPKATSSNTNPALSKGLD